MLWNSLLWLWHTLPFIAGVISTLYFAYSGIDQPAVYKWAEDYPKAARRLGITLAVLCGLGVMSAWQQDGARQSETNGLISGGDSYPFIAMGLDYGNKLAFWIQNPGDYPLYDVSFSVVDLKVFREILRRTKAGESKTPEDADIRKSMKYYSVGNMPKHTARQMFSLAPLPGTTEIEFTFQFSARNGETIESFRAIKTGTSWTNALRVTHDGRTVTESIPDDFPKKSDGSLF